MVYTILFALAGLFGLYQLFRTTDIFSLIILGGQIISLVMVLIVEPPFKMIGAVLLMLTFLSAIIYALIKHDLKISKRVLIIFSVGLVLFIHLVPVMHRNELRILGLGMIIPIGASVVLIAKDAKNYRNELGFLIIILMDGFSQFLESLQILYIIRLPFT